MASSSNTVLNAGAMTLTVQHLCTAIDSEQLECYFAAGQQQQFAKMIWLKYVCVCVCVCRSMERARAEALEGIAARQNAEKQVVASFPKYRKDHDDASLL